MMTTAAAARPTAGPAAIYGDPVQVTGTGVPLPAAAGDIYNWAIPGSNG
jgi:hypothetical protein